MKSSSDLSSKDANRVRSTQMRNQYRALTRTMTTRDTSPWARVYSGPLPTGAVYGRSGLNETKGVDISLVQANVLNTTNSNAGSTVLNLVAPGTGSYNRVGRKISMKSVRLTGTATFISSPNAATGNKVSSVVRMVVVYDNQPSGAIPTFDTIFGKTTQDGTESTTYMDALKYDNMGRFRVLRDVMLTATLAANTAGGTANTNYLDYCFDEYIKLGGLETVYSGQSSPCSIADISSGGLYVFFRADDNSDPERTWTIQGWSYARLRYID